MGVRHKTNATLTAPASKSVIWTNQSAWRLTLARDVKLIETAEMNAKTASAPKTQNRY